MTTPQRLLEQRATEHVDSNIESNKTPPNQNFVEALDAFEADAPNIEKYIFGGIAAQNAVTGRLQEAIGFKTPDGVLGPITAKVLFGRLDHENVKITDYPTLDGFLKDTFTKLYEEHFYDELSETIENAQSRNATIKKLSETLHEKFNATKTAILDRYYNHGVLRNEIEAMIRTNTPRNEITEKMVAHYNEILNGVPEEMRAFIKEALELEGTDVDDFARQQVQEVFDAIDSEAAIEPETVPRRQFPSRY